MKRNYIIGYLLSLALTLIAFMAVYDKWVDGASLLMLVVACAAAQLVAQLYFFLHLQDEARPRWRLIASAFTVVVLGIVIGGSVWIMENLNYNMHYSPQQINEYMIKESNKGF